MRNGILIAVFSLWAGAVPAADWRLQARLERAGPKVYLLLDASSMIRTNGILQFWTETVLGSEIAAKTPKQEGPDAKELNDAVMAKTNAGYVPLLAEQIRGTVSNDEFLKVAASIAVMEAVVTKFRPKVRNRIFTEIDCGTRQARNTAVVAYDDDGTLQKSDTFPNASFSPLVPNSIFDEIGKQYCGDKPLPK
jgi:hypothetical protein